MHFVGIILAAYAVKVLLEAKALGKIQQEEDILNDLKSVSNSMLSLFLLINHKPIKV